MARPPGSRNRDYEAERARLALLLASGVVGREGVAVSERELASIAAISVPTLRHYFGDRDGAWKAAVEALGRRGAEHIARAGAEDHGPPGPSTRWLLDSFVDAWSRYRVGATFGAGLALGLRSEAVGPAFINGMLEPTLQAAERRITEHIRRGEMAPVPVRVAALALLSPVVLALLHQGPLGGDRCRPLDMGMLIEQHHEAWLRGWVRPPESDLPRASAAERGHPG